MYIPKEMNLNEQVAKSDNEIEQKDMIFGFSLKHNLSKNWNCFEKNSSFVKVRQSLLNLNWASIQKIIKISSLAYWLYWNSGTTLKKTIWAKIKQNKLKFFE